MISRNRTCMAECRRVRVLPKLPNCGNASKQTWAFMRSLARMDNHVPCQSALLSKRSSASFAFERLLSSMRAKMKCQSLCAQTRSVARSTRVWCDEHVSSRVNSQSAFMSKRFITHFAFERLLASMNTLVIFQTLL